MRSDHLPFPMPERPHSLVQEWKNLTFMHWEVDPVKLAKYIPDGLEVDLFEGRAYIGTIPFIMANVRPRMTFPIPGVSTFPEINIRTYEKGDRAGVLFLTLEAQSLVTCSYATRAYGLPYRYSVANVRSQDGKYQWNACRKDGSHGIIGECTWDKNGGSGQEGYTRRIPPLRGIACTPHTREICV